MGTDKGVGAVTRAVAEKETTMMMRTSTGTRMKSGRVEERQRTTIKHIRVADAIRHFHSARVIISADRRWCLRPPQCSAR